MPMFPRPSEAWTYSFHTPTVVGAVTMSVFARHRASVWLRSPRIVRIASRPTHTQPAQMLSRWKSPLNHATEEATMKAGTAKPVRKE